VAHQTVVLDQCLSELGGHRRRRFGPRDGKTVFFQSCECESEGRGGEYENCKVSHGFAHTSPAHPAYHARIVAVFSNFSREDMLPTGQVPL
jgi:hypothetical protein